MIGAGGADGNVPMEGAIPALNGVRLPDNGLDAVSASWRYVQQFHGDYAQNAHARLAYNLTTLRGIRT